MIKKMHVYTRSFLPILLVSALGLSGCGSHKPESAPKQVQKLPQVKVQTLRKESHSIWIEFSSKAEAYESATVTARVGGEIVEQRFQAGDEVHKGDILFFLDKSDYLAAYYRALAQLEKDRAALELAEADVERFRPLIAEDLVPRQKWEQFLSARKELQATIKADQGLVTDAKLKLSYCEVKAPISGHIGEEQVKVGNMVTAGTTLASIVKDRKLQVKIFPSSAEFAQIRHYRKKPDSDVEVYLRGAPRLRLHGVVDFVAPRVDETTGTVEMRAHVDNPKGIILPGSFVVVRLIIDDALPVVSIAPDWVFQDQEGEFIYTVDANNTLRKAHFRSLFSNGEMIVLPDDFAGKRVLVQPAGSLVEGSRVEAIPAEGNVSSGA